MFGGRHGIRRRMEGWKDGRMQADREEERCMGRKKNVRLGKRKDGRNKNRQKGRKMYGKEDEIRLKKRKDERKIR